MKIKNEYPPNYKKIAEIFDVDENTIFCYGDTIYNPKNHKLDPFLIAHEEVHSKQQEEIGVEEWWDRYIISPEFRLSQEIEAYQAQYRKTEGRILDRNARARFLNTLAKELSGSLYDKIISYAEAVQAIKSSTTYKFKI